VACPGPDHPAACSASDLRGLHLDLSPGVWAVVVQAHAGSSSITTDAGAGEPVTASQCLDVIVDEDGVSSTMLGSDVSNHCAACPVP
jgi:hypothetical protein